VQKIYNVLLDTMGTVANPAFIVNTNDLQTVKINLLINQDGDPLDLTGATVRLAVKKPDKTTVLQDFTVVDAEDGSCEIVLNTQAYVVAGKYDAEVMIYFDVDTVAVTGRFSYVVIKGILDDETVESANEWQSINQAIADAEGVLEDLRVNGTGVDAQARADIATQATELADIATNIRSYGAVADGTDVTQKFISACNAAVLLGVPLRLNKGTYLINLTSNINIPSIIGNNTELIVNGNYSLVFDDNFLSYGVTYTSNNVTDKANTPTLNVLLKNKNSVMKNITLRNVKFKANGLADGTTKGNIAFNVATVEGLYMENVEVDCFRMAFQMYQGKSKTIHGKNIRLTNVETGFYISGSPNTSSVRDFATDIKLTSIYHINTATQALNYYRLQGADTFMIEKCKDVHFTDIHSENVTERSLYASCVEDVYIDDVRIIDTNGIKFSGKHDLATSLENYSVNCHLRNINFTSVSKSEGLMFALQFTKGAYINKAKMDGNNIADAFLQIDNHTEDLFIDNVNVKNLKRSVIIYADTAGIAGVPELGIPLNPEGNYRAYLKNIEVKNVRADNVCRIDYHVFRIMDSATQPTTGQYKYENITLENVKVINQTADQFGEYTGSTCKGLFSINHVKGLSVKECKVNGYSVTDVNGNKQAFPFQVGSNSYNVTIKHKEVMRLDKNTKKFAFGNMFLSPNSELMFEIIDRQKVLNDAGTIRVISNSTDSVGTVDILTNFKVEGFVKTKTVNADDSISLWGVSGSNLYPIGTFIGTVKVLNEDGKSAEFTVSKTKVVTLVTGDATVFDTTGAASKLSVMKDFQNESIILRDKRNTGASMIANYYITTA
jgi:hypothetical protein